jgi:hypothetical protein
VFTSGIVSTGQGWKIALYFTGREHAGENIADVLKRRATALPAPIQMCDALSRNVPKLAAGVEILLANCLAHGRRQFVEVAANFPKECRYVVEMLGQVYGHDAEARAQAFTPKQRLRFHQERSGLVMQSTARLAGGAVRRAQDGAELRAGQGHHLSVAALAAVDAVSPTSRSPVG